jgi:chromosome segregation ATPase
MENNQIDQAPYMSVHEQEDMNYFESELKRLETTIEVPMRTRRLESHHNDPMDELVDVYEEVKEMEENLAKAINIANFIISKNKDMFAANVEIQEELETVDLER